VEQSIETFYKSVAQNPAALSELTTGVQTPEEFIDRAVSIGNEQGYQFTRDEASTWINSQIEARKNGELSDVQLEGVAGGKGSAGGALITVNNAVSTAINPVNSVSTVGGLTNTIGGPGTYESAGRAVSSWVASW
jgi:hypothetical protein